MEKKIHDGYVKIDGNGRPYLVLFFKTKTGSNFSIPITLSDESNKTINDLLDSYGDELDTGLKIERRTSGRDRRLPARERNFFQKIYYRFK